jgi:hypothetical protein
MSFAPTLWPRSYIVNWTQGVILIHFFVNFVQDTNL